MLDPVILAVIVVVISVIGAAFFLLGSKGVENKAKKGDQIQPSKVATPPASSASTEAAASSNSTFRVKIPEIPIREVGKGMNGLLDTVKFKDF